MGKHNADDENVAYLMLGMVFGIVFATIWQLMQGMILIIGQWLALKGAGVI